MLEIEMEELEFENFQFEESDESLFRDFDILKRGIADFGIKRNWEIWNWISGFPIPDDEEFDLLEKIKGEE